MKTDEELYEKWSRILQGSFPFPALLLMSECDPSMKYDVVQNHKYAEELH